MLTFRMDETNFDQGTRDGLRIAEGLGLKVDFDEFPTDADTLGLWHLHNGACYGEGAGLDDASGGGHDLDNHGAESAETGYRFVRDYGNHMDAPYAGQPQRSAVTLECWVGGWSLGDEESGLVAAFGLDGDTQMYILAERYPSWAPGISRIDGVLRIGGEAVYANYRSAEATAILEGPEPWHVALVLDADAPRLALYVNGEKRAEETDDPTLAPLTPGDYTLRLGRWITGWNGHDLSATLDEVRLSGTARYASGFSPYRLLASGTLASPTFDATRTRADWTDLAPQSVLPAGTGIAWEVRAADETDAGGCPQALWQGYGGDPADLPDGRFFQWRAVLSADAERLDSPTVESAEAVASEAGYNLYHAAGAVPASLDYTEPWARLGPAVGRVETAPLAAGAVHWFGVRPVDADGRETPTTGGEVRLELDADGSLVPDRPAAALALSAEARPAGTARLRWRYRVGAGGVAPALFRIFGDGGSGTVDYDTPLGEVPFRQGHARYAWTSGALTPGVELQLAVRAVAAGDVWDGAPAVAAVTPDATPPGPVNALNAETLP